MTSGRRAINQTGGSTIALTVAYDGHEYAVEALGQDWRWRPGQGGVHHPSYMVWKCETVFVLGRLPFAAGHESRYAKRFCTLVREALERETGLSVPPVPWTSLVEMQA